MNSKLKQIIYSKKKNLENYLDNNFLFLKPKSISTLKKLWQNVTLKWENCDPDTFKSMSNYFFARKKQINKYKMDDIKVDFIDYTIFTGAFGMYYHFQVLAESNILNLNKNKAAVLMPRIIFDFPKKYSITNMTLFTYFKKHFTLISDDKSIRILKSIFNFFYTPINLCIPVSNNFYFVDIAKNLIISRQISKKKKDSFLKLTKDDYNKGISNLKKFGIDEKKDWYVVLHVREGKSSEKNSEFFRNGNIEDYSKAIKFITDNGGYVFRMGDKNMKPIIKQEKVIDYAHHDLKSEFMDIFLAATSRFCIGTASGFYRVAGYFNVPVILTNTSHTITFLSLQPHDIFLPSLLRDNKTNKFLNFETLFSVPFSMVNSNVMKFYKKKNVSIQKNSSEDIYFATQEMLDKIKKKDNYSRTKNQIKFKEIVENNSKIYSDSKIIAHATLPEKFLEKNQNLL